MSMILKKRNAFYLSNIQFKSHFLIIKLPKGLLLNQIMKHHYSCMEITSRFNLNNVKVIKFSITVCDDSDKMICYRSSFADLLTFQARFKLIKR